MDLLDLSSFVDPTQLGLDGGITISINGLTSRLNDWLTEIGWYEKVKRLHYFFPFLTAFAVVAVQHSFTNWTGILTDTLKYGTYATMLFHGHNKVVQGK